MANYKRGKSRVQTSPHTSQRIREKQKERTGFYHWTWSYPRWWDIVYHTRPARRRSKAISADIVSGRCDPEEAMWDPEHKPHKYYW